MTMPPEVTLEDKYVLPKGRVYMTGIQSLVRLPLEQRRLDLAKGLDTAGYITGYRGSPLGTYDQQLSRAKAHLDSHHIVFRPAVNEDLAATACSGTQQSRLDGEGKYDGVFAIWYGKGPGVDRSGDALRHANLFGTDPNGGVLCLLGDDHTCESSTTAHQSEFACVDAMIPILSPAGVQEILDYGLWGIALSRFSGALVALKCVHDTVESTASVDVDPARIQPLVPDDYTPPPGGLNIRWPDTPLAMEERLHVHKLPAAQAFVRANRLDRVVLGDAQARIGVIAAGKSYMDLVQALEDLGIDAARAHALGVRVFKPALVWPLEPQALEAACRGLETLIVVEEKRGLIEPQVKELLYGEPGAPVVIGKRDEMGAPLFPSHGALNSNQVALALGRRILARSDDPALRARIEEIEARERAAPGDPPMLRTPYFCAGCPHSTSTRVPEGSKARAGIGCHYMAQWMERDTERYTQMGGEGAGWVGEAPFVKRPHMFQNIGDGTYYHSGSLAVRHAVACGVNVTFKILYNDAVAMTGGQRMEVGNLTVPRIARELEAEGVVEIAVVTDDPDKYPLDAHFPPGTKVHHRDELDAVQRRMREIEGVTAIIYDQTCAAEKRRRRKTGEMVDPDVRVFINEQVCEGCGDCGTQSNCVAVQPVETELGRKRRIDQSACNKDLSCLKGFCPSFVTIEGARIRKAARSGAQGEFPPLPEPELPALTESYGIVVTGIGGTGVITISALLGMAAHLDGKGVGIIDMIGMAQKGGAVVSHLKLAASPEQVGAPRVAAGAARLILGCDMVVTASKPVLATVRAGVTRAVVNAERTYPGDVARKGDMPFPEAALRQRIERALGEHPAAILESSRLAARLVGDSIGANLMMVGYAWQKGLIPLSRASIERAIELNGVQVELNRQAFLWGRRAAVDPAAVRAIAGEPAEPARPLDLDALIEHRVGLLTAYQDRAWAERYRAVVARVRRIEEERVPGSSVLAEAVARNLAKLMSYKDEYEVARLYSDGSFARALREQFEGDLRLTFHMAPPLLADRDPRTGVPRKRRFGPWMLGALGWLARLKWLRGTAFDPFGRTAERRAERALIGEYEALVEELLAGLRADRLEQALELARLPEQIRGFGHVKERNLAQARERWQALLAAWRAAPAEALRAAE